MILKKISIINYKNIEAADIVLSPKINCFVGHNGEGKTNFLDAVFFLSFCKSAFTSIDTQTIMHDKDFFVIEGHYVSENGSEENIYCGLKRGTKKHFKRNKKEYKRLSQHIGLIPLVFISPSDNLLIEGGSEERRRLLDLLISQYDNTYIDTLNRYNKALQQRNALLKMIEEPDSALLDLWEEQMAETGEALFAKREVFVKELIPVFQDIYNHVCDNKEKVSLQYISHCQRGPLLDVIKRDRDRDRAVGYSLHGIHRDDLEMLLNEYPIKREGSQGQRKTFVLALKLAQFVFLKQKGSNTAPLLLLDDIFDKLDAERVERIVNLVGKEEFGQIFITDTNREHIDKMLHNHSFDYKLFVVNHGEIKEKEANHVQA